MAEGRWPKVEEIREQCNGSERRVFAYDWSAEKAGSKRFEGLELGEAIERLRAWHADPRPARQRLPETPDMPLLTGA